MIRLYIIRHGETEPNTRYACLGRKDVPLNGKGRQQARELAVALSGVLADAVFVSPLKRAKETIAPYLEGNKMRVSEDERITERDFGEWDDMTFSEIEAEDPERYAAWRGDFIRYAPPGGESSAAVQERVNDFLDDIEKSCGGKTVFIITHLGTARHLISRALALDTEESWRFTVDNGKYAVIDYDEKTREGVLKYLNV